MAVVRAMAMERVVQTKCMRRARSFVSSKVVPLVLYTAHLSLSLGLARELPLCVRNCSVDSAEAANDDKKHDGKRHSRG